MRAFRVLVCYFGLFALIPIIAGQSVSVPNNGSVTLRVDAGKSDESAITVLKTLSELIVGLAWPTVVVVVCLSQRRPISGLLTAATEFLRASKHIKVGQLIDIEADRNAREAEQKTTLPRDVPAQEIESAARVSMFVNDAELPAVRARMLEYAREYESLRAQMGSGLARTRAMNAVVAKMRTLALAARPLLRELASNENSPGSRLSAIVILQLNPSAQFIDWLAARMKEEQPFLLFHASLALLAAVRSLTPTYAETLQTAIKAALGQVLSFKGTPDSNTVETLNAALYELQAQSIAAHQ